MLLSKLTRHFFSTSKLSNIPSKHRPKALKAAQEALIDYLHATKSVPYAYADLITRNSPSSLHNLISSLDFSPTNFSRTLARHLRYHPINEFEFFFESIGINPEEIPLFSPSDKLFLSEEDCFLNASCALSVFGFSWNRLGELYKKQVSIFRKAPEELKAMLSGFKNRGFSSVMVISICYTFPQVLAGENDNVDALFDDFKRIFLDHDVIYSVEANADGWCQVCRKIRLLYDLGFQKGKVGDLMKQCKTLFFQYPEEVLVQKVMYFRKFGFSDHDVGWLIVHRLELLNLDLETPAISIMGSLKHFRMQEEELKSLASVYPYVLGRNRMANLPQVIRALDLQDWFLKQMKKGDNGYLATYVMNDPGEDLDQVYINGLEEIRSLRCHIHIMNKLMFLHSIGFGENAFTIWVLYRTHGSSSELQERFDCLLGLGIDFWRLCKMISFCPKVLNQQARSLEQKVNFLFNEMGASLDFLAVFPAILCYDLENRIAPRYSCHKWLMEQGLYRRSYSFASIVATSEKNFIARLSAIHPAIPKIWFECFSSQRN